MTEAVIPVKHLDDLTECAICHETFTDPRTLPCFHTFCFTCITEWYKEKQPQDYVDCPLCRKKLKIPDQGVNEFPKNPFIGKLLIIKELSINSLKPELCGWCESVKKTKCGAAKVYCPDCQVHLCETCEGLHGDIPATRQHNTYKSGETTSESYVKCMPTKCDKHPDKDLELYCSECEDTVCLMCFVTQHNGHKANEVENAVNEFKAKVIQDISKLVDGVGKLDKSLAALEARRSQVVDQASEVEQEICKKAEQLKQMVDHQRDKLLSDVIQLKVGKTKVVDNDIIEVKQNKAMMEGLIKYCQELMQKGSNSDIMRETKSVNRRAEEMATICESELFFDTSEQIISFTAAEVITDAVNCIGKVRESEAIGQSQILGPTLPLSSSLGSGVAAIAAFDDSLFIAYGDCSRSVEVYDTSALQQVRAISIPGCESWGLATCSAHKCLYVSDCASNSIHKVSLPTYTVTSWSIAGADQPRGLSVTRSHELLVACLDSKKIQVYSTTGSLVREIADINSYVWQAIELSDGTLAVSECGPVVHGISLMSVDGSVLRSYDHGSQSVQMSNPRSLAVDKRGFVVVADYSNDRLVVLNPTLMESHLLSLPVSPGITNPMGLCYDESRRRLYVGEWSGNKRLMMVDNVYFHDQELSTVNGM